jgi:FMN reductase
MLNVVVLCGNPKADSRTLRLGEAVAAAVVAEHDHELTVIDLALHTGSIFAWPSDEMAELSRIVAESDLLVVASPTYKATYTGLLKSFLDRYSANGLAGVVAIPVMTGAAATHSMAPETGLRPLLVELGASAPTRSLYFITAHMDQLEQAVETWADDNARVLQSLQPLIDTVWTRVMPPVMSTVKEESR